VNKDFEFLPSGTLMSAKETEKYRATEMIYGAHPIIEVLKAKKRKLFTIYTTRSLPKAWDRLVRYLPAQKPQINYVDRSVLDRIAGCTDHNGVIAQVAPFKYTSKVFDPTKKPFILLLDSLHDVRNLGAILRSAYCMGIDGVVLCKTKAAPLTAAAFKASAGLAEHMDIYAASSLKQAVAELKQAGYGFYMAVLDGKDATTVDYKQPLCVVIGNEAVGITPEIRKMGIPITLPQRSPDISYNASVAAAMVMFLVSMKIGKI
jgi:23S rRNA (guanosine2251-2'-O)-methyltransferase